MEQLENPPLTDSGFFETSSSASVDNVVWSQIRACRNVSAGGEDKRGVVIAQHGNGKIVFKSSQDPAREVFLTRLCRHLGVSAPAIRLLARGTPEYGKMSGVVRGLVLRPAVLVMEFVEGEVLGGVSRKQAEVYRLSPREKMCGRIVTLRLLLLER